MQRRTKVILVIVAGLLVIAGIFGATTAFADSSSSTSGNTTSPLNTLLQKVADQYNSITGQTLDVPALEKAFQQAQAQVRQDNVKAFLDGLVKKGVITQAQEDQYLSWLNSKPDVPQLNGRGGPLGQFFSRPGFGSFFGGFGHRGHGESQSQNQTSFNQEPLTQPTF